MWLHNSMGENEYYLKLLETFPDTGLLSTPSLSSLVTNRCSQAYQKLRMAHPMVCSPGRRDKVEMLHCCTTCIRQALRQLVCAILPGSMPLRHT